MKHVTKPVCISSGSQLFHELRVMLSLVVKQSGDWSSWSTDSIWDLGSCQLCHLSTITNKGTQWASNYQRVFEKTVLLASNLYWMNAQDCFEMFVITHISILILRDALYIYILFNLWGVELLMWSYRHALHHLYCILVNLTSDH